MAEENGGYSLIFMDCNMPVMDGCEATQILLQKMEAGGIQRAPVIGLSAYSSEEEIERCREAGMVEVIGKPITFENLKEKLRQYGIIA